MSYTDWIALGVFIITFWALIFQIRSYNKSLLLSRMEEMYHLIDTLDLHCSKLLPLVPVLDSYYANNGSVKTLSEYNKIRDEYVTREDVMVIRNTIGNLDILATAFLSGKLRFKVLSYKTLVLHLTSYVINFNTAIKDEWDLGFFNYMNLNKLVVELQNDLINEISIYRKINFKKFIPELETYRKTAFRDILS